QAKFQYGAWTTLQRVDLELTKSHYNDAVAISGIIKTKAKPTSIMMFRQFRKKKCSLNKPTASKVLKTHNIISKRIVRYTKYDKSIWINDYVRIKDSNNKCYISGFSQSSCYIIDIFGNYLTTSDRYRKVALSKLDRLSHHNNWQKQTITEKQYAMG